MFNTNIDDLAQSLISNSVPVVLYGAGDFGQLALFALNKHNIQVAYFCDSNEDKQGKSFLNIKTISPEDLSKLTPDAHIFISNHYVTQVSTLLYKMGFKNVHSCVDLLENTDFSDSNISSSYYKTNYQWSSLKIKKEIAIHKYSCDKDDNKSSSNLNIKYVDVVITERCSMKCRDCSNLMQYYITPQNSDFDLFSKSVDRFMESIDRIGEFRVIGGDPLMNKEMFKFVNKLVTFKNADNVVIFTNATILPTGDNLECLKNEKVNLLITNYGELSRKYDELIELLDSNKILYVAEPVSAMWQDVGTLKFEEKTIIQLNHLFDSCCANDLLSLMDGKLHRCPVSAHGEKLGAIPHFEDDVVDLTEDKKAIEETRENLREFYYNKSHIHACNYCKGREYGHGEIISAVQTIKPLRLSN
jgi:hypothetical protein